MTKERRLGRGLEALLGKSLDLAHPDPELQAAPAPAATTAPGESVHKLSVHEIDANPYQPRRDFAEAEIQELADSLQAHGLLQPIVVRRAGARHQLVSGERRLRAAVRAGWSDIAVQVRDVDDRQMAELAIVENLQRKDLNPLEKAVSFQQYLQQYRCTQEELAGRLKVDRSTIANLIRLLELPQAVQDALRGGAITQGHARALLPLGDEEEQINVCRRIQDESLSVRATESLVAEAIHAADSEPLAVVGSASKAKAARPQRNQQLAALEQEFRRALGTRVDVKIGARERGKIVIHFTDHDEFDRLREQITGAPPARLAAG